MARLALNPTAQPRTGTGAPLNLTALVNAGVLGANTGVSFASTGREALYVLCGGTTSTALVNIGTTVEGVTPAAISLALIISVINVIGPFPLDEDQPGGTTIWVDFGTPANVTGVALVQNNNTI